MTKSLFIIALALIAGCSTRNFKEECASGNIESCMQVCIEGDSSACWKVSRKAGNTERFVKALAKGCELESASCCRELGSYHENSLSPIKAETYYAKACLLLDMPPSRCLDIEQMKKRDLVGMMGNLGK